jgi:UDP-N-acetylmuramyl pentapeptide phosphotransferase/UDP-N-acetylglucosamine-1-phosphate transferase
MNYFLFSPDLTYPLIISVFLCVLLVILAQVFPSLSGRSDDTKAVQAMHLHLTPRVGGVAIFGALVCGAFFAPHVIRQSYIAFLAGTSLLFFVGLREDLGLRVSPRLRMIAILVTSLIVMAILDTSLQRIGNVYVNQLLQLWFIGIPFTLLITAGVSNGFNLVDGVNGLASMTAFGASVAIALIAHLSGDAPMASVSMIVAAVTLGFLVVNYPFGLIFLGDAGAYVLGFVICWIGIIVIARVPEVSPWAVLMTMFWPIADTLLAMYRRLRARRSVMMADRLHAHQLVMRAIETCFIGHGRRQIANPLTTLFLAPFIVAPQIAAVLLWDNNLAAFFAVFVFLALFFWSFGFVLAAAKRYRLRPQASQSFGAGTAADVDHDQRPRVKTSVGTH